MRVRPTAPPHGPATPPARAERALELFRQIPWARWWKQFCRKNTKGMLQYPSSWAFCVEKGRRRDDARLLYTMIGPHSEQDSPLLRRFKAPRLGDWELRRQFSFRYGEWAEDLAVLEAINAGRRCLQEMRSSGPKLAPLIELNWRLAEQIDAAFGGEPFCPDAAADSWRSQRRCHAYFRLHGLARDQLRDCIKHAILIRTVEAYFDDRSTTTTPTNPEDSRQGFETEPARARSLTQLHRLKPTIARSLEWNVRSTEVLDHAFGGKPLLPDQPPTSARNWRRFRAYHRVLEYLFGQFRVVAELWCMVHNIENYLEPMPMSRGDDGSRHATRTLVAVAEGHAGTAPKTARERRSRRQPTRRTQ